MNSDKIQKIIHKLSEIKSDILEENDIVKETMKEKPYQIENLIRNQPSFQKLENNDFKELRYNDETISIDRSFEAFIDTDISTTEFGIILYLKDFKNQLFFPMTKFIKNKFFLEIKKNSYTCEGSISYSLELNKYVISNLKIYTYYDAFSFLCKKYEDISFCLRDRIDFVLSMFGFDVSNLLYIEKIVFLLRLVPLVEKKYLMVDISKREIGKSYIYDQLGFNLYTNNITKSSTFIDGRSGKEGDFFSEDIVYIIDEIGKVNDPNVISSIQVYKSNGNNNEGSTQVGKGNKKSSNSIIILGNPKVNIDVECIYTKRINLFENTIINEGNDGTAFLSRVDSLIPSYGCRTFNSGLMLKQDGANNSFLKIFKASLLELREKKIDIINLLNENKLPNLFNSSRETSAILKTLTGLLKIIYPEIFNSKINNIDILPKEFDFLLTIAIQTRQNVNNQIAIIENRLMTNILQINSKIRNVYFELGSQYLYTPHIILENLKNKGRVIILDEIGRKLFLGFKVNTKQISVDSYLLSIEDINKLRNIVLKTLIYKLNFLVGGGEIIG